MLSGQSAPNGARRPINLLSCQDESPEVTGDTCELSFCHWCNKILHTWVEAALCRGQNKEQQGRTPGFLSKPEVCEWFKWKPWGGVSSFLDTSMSRFGRPSGIWIISFAYRACWHLCVYGNSIPRHSPHAPAPARVSIQPHTMPLPCTGRLPKASKLQRTLT